MPKVIERRQSSDSNNIKENEYYAVFLTYSFLIASAYAFKDRIKELSEGLDWNFEIGYNFYDNKINIKMENVKVSDDLEGYIYVFSFNKNYKHDERTIQYKCYESIKPIDIVKIKFSDLKKYYMINKKIRKRNTYE